MCRSLVRFWDLKTALRDAVSSNKYNDQAQVRYCGRFYFLLVDGRISCTKSAVCPPKVTAVLLASVFASIQS